MGLDDRLDADVIRALGQMAGDGGKTQAAAAMERIAARSSPTAPSPGLPGAKRRGDAPVSAAPLQKHFARMAAGKRSHFTVANADAWMRCDVVPAGWRVRCTHDDVLLSSLERRLRSRCTCVGRKKCEIVSGSATRALAVTARCSEGRRATFLAIATAWPVLVDGGAQVTMAAARSAPTTSPKRSRAPRGKGSTRRKQPAGRRLTPIDPVVTPVERPLPADRLLKLSRRVAPVKALDPLRQFGRGFWHDTRTTEE